jgi:hypothetical protein
MLTLESGDLNTMNWGRKGALSMLVVAVLWTAMPVSACLLTMQPAGRPACCHGMAQDCDSSAMCASGSCCQAERQNAAVAPVLPYSLEHLQKLALVALPAVLQPPATPAASHPIAFEAPPPKFPPGGAFALRI